MTKPWFIDTNAPMPTIYRVDPLIMPRSSEEKPICYISNINGSDMTLHYASIVVSAPLGVELASKICDYVDSNDAKSWIEIVKLARRISLLIEANKPLAVTPTTTLEVDSGPIRGTDKTDYMEIAREI